MIFKLDKNALREYDGREQFNQILHFDRGKRV